MNGSIQRAGRWWHRHDDGGWLQWDEANEAWVATAASPPPPPPPPAGPAPNSAAPAPSRVGATRSAGARDRLGDLAYSVREKPLLSAGVGAAAVALLAFVAIAFLGGGQSSPPPAAAASAAKAGAPDAKAEFIQKADARCAAALAEQKSLLQPGTVEELPAYIDRSVGISRRLVRDLKRLRPPAEDRRLLRQMFKKADQMIALAGPLEDAAMRGDQAGVQAIVTQGEKLTNQANALALQYGFDDCSRSA